MTYDEFKPAYVAIFARMLEDCPSNPCTSIHAGELEQLAAEYPDFAIAVENDYTTAWPERAAEFMGEGAP
jgi:hypothetical protein